MPDVRKPSPGVRPHNCSPEQETNAIHENDARVAAKIQKQAQLGELASQVRIVEGYYDLDTGKVEWAAK